LIAFTIMMIRLMADSWWQCWIRARLIAF
jgi:hypothetical protein